MSQYSTPEGVLFALPVTFVGPELVVCPSIAAEASSISNKAKNFMSSPQKKSAAEPGWKTGTWYLVTRSVHLLAGGEHGHHLGDAARARFRLLRLHHPLHVAFLVRGRQGIEERLGFFLRTQRL